MTGTVKIILWLLGGAGAAAAAAGGYVYSTRQAQQPPAQIAALPEQKQAGEVEAKAGAAQIAEDGAKDEAAGEGDGDQKVAALPEAQAERPEAIAPTFGMRVEKDGSAVIAGSAAPNSKIELMAQGEVIASAQAGPEGDFAIVLDNPLGKGAHELQVRSLGADGQPLVSAETGIVNIPEGDGELIVMMSKPGEASKILQGPEAKPEQEVAALAAPEAKPEEAAPATEAAPAADAPAAAAAEAKPEEKPAGETAAAPEAKPGEAAAEAKPEEKPADAAAAEAKPEATGQGSAAQGQQEVAAVAAPTAPEAAPAAPAPRQVLVQAVDVEDGRIFVAGAGEPGFSVNIYIDDKLAGSTTVSGDGSFLLENRFDLAPGRHTIRADMLPRGGGEVAGRAEVALVHEPEAAPAQQQVAAAEPKPAEAASAGQPAAVAEARPQDKPEAPAEAKPAVDAGATAGQAVAAAEQPAAEAAPAQQQEATAAEKPVAEAAPAAQPLAEGEAVAETESAGAKVVAADAKPAAETAPEAKPAAQTEAVAEAKPAAEIAPEAKPAVQAEASAEAKPAAEAAQQSAATAVEAPSGQGAAADGQPKVAAAAGDTGAGAGEIRTGASVIIRRGDNLWKISRRMLGRGIKYTVIFEANRDQIRNPRLIYPGQVFDVPGADPATAEPERSR